MIVKIVNCESDDLCCTPEEYDKAKEIIVGLVDAIVDPGYGYKEGRRNNMAVDLCIACYCLNDDPVKDIFAQLLKDGKVSSAAFDDFKDRAETIERYLDGWERNNSDIWLMATMDSEWENFHANTENHYLKLEELPKE